MFKPSFSLFAAFFMASPAVAKQQVDQSGDLVDLDVRFERAREIIGNLNQPIDYGGVTRDEADPNKMSWFNFQNFQNFSNFRNFENFQNFHNFQNFQNFQNFHNAAPVPRPEPAPNLAVPAPRPEPAPNLVVPVPRPAPAPNLAVPAPRPEPMPPVVTVPRQEPQPTPQIKPVIGGGAILPAGEPPRIEPKPAPPSSGGSLGGGAIGPAGQPAHLEPKPSPPSGGGSVGSGAIGPTGQPAHLEPKPVPSEGGGSSVGIAPPGPGSLVPAQMGTKPPTTPSRAGTQPTTPGGSSTVSGSPSTATKPLAPRSAVKASGATQPASTAKAAATNEPAPGSIGVGQYQVGGKTYQYATCTSPGNCEYWNSATDGVMTVNGQVVSGQGTTAKGSPSNISGSPGGTTNPWQPGTPISHSPDIGLPQLPSPQQQAAQEALQDLQSILADLGDLDNQNADFGAPINDNPGNGSADYSTPGNIGPSLGNADDSGVGTGNPDNPNSDNLNADINNPGNPNADNPGPNAGGPGNPDNPNSDNANSDMDNPGNPIADNTAPNPNQNNPNESTQGSNSDNPDQQPDVSGKGNQQTAVNSVDDGSPHVMDPDNPMYDDHGLRMPICSPDPSQCVDPNTGNVTPYGRYLQMTNQLPGAQTVPANAGDIQPPAPSPTQTPVSNPADFPTVAGTGTGPTNSAIFVNTIHNGSQVPHYNADGSPDNTYDTYSKNDSGQWTVTNSSNPNVHQQVQFYNHIDSSGSNPNQTQFYAAPVDSNGNPTGPSIRLPNGGLPQAGQLPYRH